MTGVNPPVYIAIYSVAAITQVERGKQGKFTGGTPICGSRAGRECPRLWLVFALFIQKLAIMVDDD